MNTALLAVIALLLVFIVAQQLRFERWWRYERATIPPRTRYSDVAPERHTPPPSAGGGRELPFLLVRRANAGWGTLLELAPTREWKKPATYPALRVSEPPPPPLPRFPCFHLDAHPSARSY